MKSTRSIFDVKLFDISSFGLKLFDVKLYNVKLFKLYIVYNIKSKMRCIQELISSFLKPMSFST